MASSEDGRVRDPGGCDRCWCFVRVVLRQKLEKRREHVSGRGTLFGGDPEWVLTFVRKWVLDRCMVACPCEFVGDEQDSMTANKHLC